MSNAPTPLCKKELHPMTGENVKVSSESRTGVLTESWVTLKEQEQQTPTRVFMIEEETAR